MTKELERFTQLLAMTTSSFDNECLTAIRKANAMLAAKNMTWELFVKGRYPKENIDISSSKGKGNWPTDGMKSEDVEEMFTMALANSSGSFIKFLHSIYEWWEDKGFLTDKQFESLKKASEGR